jgi:hypothetical protein
MSTEPGPVMHRLHVALAPAQAFELFTQGMHRWWPFRGHSCAGDEALTVEFDPWVGGTVTEVARSGARHPWGTLTAWEPPVHFAMTWHPAQAPELATRLSVRFEPADAGCVVDLCHDGWAARGADAASVRDGYQQGWALVLGRFGAQAAQEVGR